MVKTFKTLLLQDQLTYGVKLVYSMYVAEYCQELVRKMTLGWFWHILRQGQIWETANTKDFMESFEDFGLKNGN